MKKSTLDSAHSQKPQNHITQLAALVKADFIRLAVWLFIARG